MQPLNTTACNTQPATLQLCGASCHPCCSLNCLLLTVGMKRAAAAALTEHAPKRQKLHRTNLTPGQPKMCHVCRRMLPSRNKLMLHLRHGHPACTTRTTRTSTDQASATEAPATNQASATEASAINQAPATEASATNQASATATDRNQPAAPVAAQSTQTRASPARTSQHLQWTAPAYRPVQRSSPHPSAIAFAVIASTTRTLAAISAVSSVASLVARRGTVTSATAAVAAASVVAFSATPVSARLRSRRPAVATAGPTARTTIAPTRPPSPPLAAAARSRALIQQASQPCSMCCTPFLAPSGYTGSHPLCSVCRSVISELNAPSEHNVRRPPATASASTAGPVLATAVSAFTAAPTAVPARAHSPPPAIS